MQCYFALPKPYERMLHLVMNLLACCMHSTNTVSLLLRLQVTTEMVILTVDAKNHRTLHNVRWHWGTLVV